MRCERGQASVEWTGVALLLALALGGMASLAPTMDGRSFGGFLAHRIVCAVKGGCDDGDAALARAYGKRDAELVRRLAPGVVYERGEAQLPVDYRRCRERRCADAPDDPALDAHRSHSGERATVFVRLIRRRGRTYVQYWLYYPDSNTTWAGSDKAWDWTVGRLVRGGYPGFHLDDWEAHHVRIDPDGDVFVRASSHGHWQACKQRRCRNRWTGRSGWTRVSRGSHAGHIPKAPARGERTSTAEGLRLIPLESIDHRAYEPKDPSIKPPWRKEAYREPESGAS